MTEDIKPYVAEVCFVGQPSVYECDKTATVGSIEGLDKSKIGTEFSPNVKSNLSGALYEYLVNELRNWYPSNSDTKNNMFSTYIYINKDAREIKSAQSKVSNNNISYKIEKEDMQDLQEILDSKSSVPNNQTNPNNQDNQDNQETNDAPNSWHVADISFA